MTRARRLALLAGAAVAVGAAGAIVVLRGPGEEDRPVGATGRPPFDVLYRPPTFVAPSKEALLAYEIVCPLTRPPEAGFCVPTGTLHVRRTDERDFDSITLETPRPHLAVARVPAEYTSGVGFDYYVDIRDERGRLRTVPRGGAAAAQRAWAVARWTRISLGRHRFGEVVAPQTLVRARWGAGRGRVARRRGIGPSAFAVGVDGTIVVLDQGNRRLAVYRAGRPRYFPIRFLGGEGDVAVAPDGTVYVLDAGRARTRVAFVRSYDVAFAPLDETRVAEAPADRLHAGPAGAVVRTAPSEEWLPVGRGAALLAPPDQAAGARPALEFARGEQVAVVASGREARFALFRGERLAGSWRIESATPYGEVQLAEPFGDGLLVVIRVHARGRAEWEVLVLEPGGLRARFAVATVEDADAAPGGRFRRQGAWLYALQSGRTGARVVRYPLPGR